MTIHAWLVLAFLLLVVAMVLAALHNVAPKASAWALAFLAAGLAAWVLPAAFQLHR